MVFEIRKTNLEAGKSNENIENRFVDYTMNCSVRFKYSILRYFVKCVFRDVIDTNRVERLL